MRVSDAYTEAFSITVITCQKDHNYGAAQYTVVHQLIAVGAHSLLSLAFLGISQSSEMVSLVEKMFTQLQEIWIPSGEGL